MDSKGRLTRQDEWKIGARYEWAIRRSMIAALRDSRWLAGDLSIWPFVCVEVKWNVNSPGGNNRPGVIALRSEGPDAKGLTLSCHEWRGRFRPCQ